MLHENAEEYCDEVNEIQGLLKKWDLSHLEQKFKEHEISIQSLCWLTSEDICELIPKIGPRAIFRARLLEWQKDNKNNKNKINNNFDLNNKNSTYETATIIKSEPDFENHETSSIQIPDQTEYENDQSIHNGSDTPLSPPSFVIDDVARVMTTACENDIHEIKGPKRDKNSLDINPNLNIRTTLMNNPEGRQALRFYEINRKLDFKYRRIVTAIVINLAVDKKIWLGCKEFQRMANEINQIFPNESTLTYYMPRVGIQSPRGALYNKYLNMSRKLRLEGRLEYRRNRSVGQISMKKSRFYD